MRILLVSEDVPAEQLGGAGQHAVVLGNALLAAGHDVHLLGYQAPGIEGSNGFRGPLHRLIDFAGTRWHEERFGVFMPMARPAMARRLWAAIQRLPGPWDVVHYHGHNALLGTLVPAAWNYLHTLHDQGAECMTKTRFRAGQACRTPDAAECAGCAVAAPNALQRAVSASAVRGLRRGALAAYTRHTAVFVSDFLRRRFLAQQPQAATGARLEVVHNFIDPARLVAGESAAARLPAPWADDGRVRVFAAGRLDANKGFMAWLQALLGCDPAAFSRLDIALAGNGPDASGLRSRFQSQGLRLLGWCDPATVLAHTARADVCVVPSVWDEPCATTVLEALALGRPVLALARGGTPELARYGEPGQLRLFDDLPALSRALLQGGFQPAPPNRRAAVEQRLPELMALYRAPAALRLAPEPA